MILSDAQKLLSLAQTWETAADLHEKAMRRNRSFAREGNDLYDFYLSEAAREEIRAKLCRSHAQTLRDIVTQIQAEASPNPFLEEAKNSATGL